MTKPDMSLRCAEYAVVRANSVIRDFRITALRQQEVQYPVLQPGCHHIENPSSRPFFPHGGNGHYRLRRGALYQRLRFTPRSAARVKMDNTFNRNSIASIAEVIVSPVDKKTLPGEDPVFLCNYTDVYYNSYITGDMSFMEATAPT